MGKTAIVTTTIRMPVFLEDIAKNIAAYRHEAEVAISVIGDVKTPSEAGRYCRGLADKFGFPVAYLDLAAQERSLAPYPELASLVPLNSGARKLLGGFLAWRDGCDTLILVDDDNFPTDIDFVGSHNIVGQSPELKLVSSGSGWFNPYEAVIEERNLPIYPRGFPWGQRSPAPPPHRIESKSLRVVVNSGLVLEDPDVDAVSRLFWPIRVTGMHQEWSPHFGLAPGTWSSFNDQNAACAGDFVPIYFAPPSTGRNADIWASYVVCRLVQHFGDVVSFGYPLVRQLRNPHDLWEDLERELLNIRAADQFVFLLRSIPLTKPTYLEALGELLSEALRRLPQVRGVSDAGRNMMENFFKEYLVWYGVCSRVAADQKAPALARA